MFYAMAITLRNCGRFTMVASDFGSDYRTHTHVTSEALYASLTRGATWRARLIDLGNDSYAFTAAYDVVKMPLWFVPGIFVSVGGCRLSEDRLDTTVFNVVQEFYPNTSKSYIFRKGILEERKRPHWVPTYGNIQAIKPDQRLVTYAFSTNRELLDGFASNQTFILGKKRTMFQIVGLSPVIEGSHKRGPCLTGWLELPPTYGGRFQCFEVLAATMRYLIVRGTTREEVDYLEFPLPGESLCLPDFYLEQTPIGTAIMPSGS